MKKLIITSVIVLAAVSSQAANVLWNDTDGVGNWATATNWVGDAVPQTTDLWAWVRGNNTVWPTIDSGVPNVENLAVGHEAGNHGELTVVDGGRISPMAVYVGVRTTGVLNMSGGIVTAQNKLGIGWADGVGTINLTGDALFFFLDNSNTGNLSWSPGSVVNVSDDAIFLVTGNHTNATWIADGLIANPDGDPIVASYDPGSGRTFFESAGPAVQVTNLTISVASGEVVLSWTAVVAKTYGVETNIDLTVTDNWGDWKTGLEVPGGGSLNVTNVVVVDETFYRVISE